MSHSERRLAKHCSNETIESKWTEVLLSWLNKCVNPSLNARELNLQCLLDVIKQYDKRICTKANINAFSADDVETILKRRYPALQIRNLTRVYDSKYQFKKLYIAITVFLFEACMNQTSEAGAIDICRRLQKHELQMILKVCQYLKAVEMTVVNIEASIKAAFIETFGTAISKKRETKNNIETRAQEQDEEILGVDPSCTRCAKTNKDVEKTSSHELKTLLPPRDAKDSELRIRSRLQTDCSSELLEMDVNEDVPCMSHSFSSKTSLGPTCCGRSFFRKRTRNSSRSSSQDVNNNPGGIRWNLYCALASMVLLAVVIVILCSISLWDRGDEKTEQLAQENITTSIKLKRLVRGGLPFVEIQWQCKNNFCLKAKVTPNTTIYKSLSRCMLLCMGLQIWPHPTGYTQYSKDIIALSTKNLEYKFQLVPSEMVHNYLAGAFKLFLRNVLKLEKNDRNKPSNQTNIIDLPIKRISIEIEVESDPDPRLRLDTEESYMIKINTLGSRVVIKVTSTSFCGVRHGLETASQLILLDQDTGHLITLSEIAIKDSPSYKYRGLMLDTGRNYIPVSDIMRTLDGMASCKLNTFHWRISSDTSFPLYLTKLPYLSDYGAYDRSMIYTKIDVKSIVKKAALRGIRVLIEVAAPGPVGRAWSWFPQATCPLKTNNYTCQNVLCTRLLMDKAAFDALQILYSEILEMTGVNDIFHLSNGMFSMTNCYQLISDRDGFLNNALHRLKLANKGNLPELPIIWYTPHLMKDSEAKTWERLGVQLSDWEPNPGEHYLGKFRVIHSTNWDLSCKVVKQRCVKFRTWQEMYSWKIWRNVESFSIEGGEAILWTDLVNGGITDSPLCRACMGEEDTASHVMLHCPAVSTYRVKYLGSPGSLPEITGNIKGLLGFFGNIDTLLWPRAIAVAERLWSGTIANSTANKYVYMRLDRQRWRMILRGIRAQPIWPAWCSFNPSTCLAKIRK